MTHFNKKMVKKSTKFTWYDSHPNEALPMMDSKIIFLRVSSSKSFLIN